MIHIKLLQIAICFSMLLTLSASCSNDAVVNPVLTNEEVVELIETSFQTGTAGLTDNIEKITDEVSNNLTFGVISGSAFNKSYLVEYNGAFVQAYYSANLSYEITSNELNIPQTADIYLTNIGTFNSAKISSDHNSQLTANVTGLQPSEASLTLNGNYSRSGTQELSFNSKKKITSLLEADLSNLTIDKSSQRILSGKATILLTSTNQRYDFSYSATLTFLGNKQSTLILNGIAYDVDLN